MEYILCLDVSLSCTGYAIFDNKGNLVDKGLVDTKYIKNKDSEVHSEKLLYIFNTLNKIEKEYNFSKVIIERSFVRFNKATKAIQKALGVIELLFNKKEIMLISPQSTKSFLCKKDASKEDIIKAINFLYDLDLSIKEKDKEDNIADAIALGHYYYNKEK